MRPAITLGLRLATGTGGQRSRSLATGAANALGALLLLLVWGIAHSQVGTTTAFSTAQVNLLIMGTIGMVGLPVLILIATIARLSARVRDRRLANLRLLGLSAAQTRMVAATEVGAASLLGTFIGAVAFVAITPLVSRIDVPGRDWSASSLIPPLLAWVCVLAALPLVSILTAALPQRLAAGSGISQPPKGDARRGRILRVVPLLVGFALCWGTRSPLFDDPHHLSSVELAIIPLGIGLLAIGMILVIPVFVSMVAAIVLRLGNGPLATLVGRRLQTQPASTTRVISALILGLFVVVGAQGVLAAFFATPQYERAADFVERAQRVGVMTTPADLAATRSSFSTIQGVTRVTSFPLLGGDSIEAGPDSGTAVIIVVASCADLAGPGAHIDGCSDAAPSVLNAPWFLDGTISAIEIQAAFHWEPRGRTVSVPLHGVTSIDTTSFDRGVGTFEGSQLMVLPPDTPEIQVLLTDTDWIVIAHAGPGRYLYDAARAEGFKPYEYVDLENYEFVQGMRTLVWTLAAVVLSIGLLTFTIAGIDRALGRRRELTALRLVGTPGSLLRRAQWLEMALPTVFGSLLAIVAGAYAGATYLQLDDDRMLPLTTAGALAAAAIVASMVLAGITTVGTTARLDPEHIRAE